MIITKWTFSVLTWDFGITDIIIHVVIVSCYNVSCNIQCHVIMGGKMNQAYLKINRINNNILDNSCYLNISNFLKYGIGLYK